jgi:hypothetical protein
MISVILPYVLTVVTAATPTPAPAPPATVAEPAIRVTLNHQSYNRGDRARVTVRVRDDGYVVVLHEDPNGHVRVLYPVDPGDDNFLKAGQDYEIRGRGDRDAFQVTATGTGTVYAAVSMDPYRFDDFTRNNHWDYARLDDDSTAANDPEAALTNIVEQMANGNHFDYDVATYTAEAKYASTTQAYIVPGSSYGYGCLYGSWDPWCDGYYPSPSYFSLSIGFGGFFGHRGYGYPYGYGYGYPYGRGFGYGYGYPIYYGGGYGRGYGRGYGAAGYGYSVGHGWSYNHRPVVLGAGGAYTGGAPMWGLGSTGSVGYRTRGALVNQRASTSPLYGVSRFNTQRGPSRGVESPNRFGGRREISGGRQSGFETRVENTRPSAQTGMRPGPRNDGVGQSHVDERSAPTRVEPRTDSRPTRVEPRAEPRSEPRAEPRSEPRAQPRSEPRAEPRARAPERSGGGGGGGGGGRRGGGGGGGGRRP